MTPDKNKPSKLKRARWLAAAFGTFLGILCNLAPPDYQDACHAVTKIALITCGGM